MSIESYKGRFHEINKPLVTMNASPEYIAAVDRLSAATGHKSRSSLISEALYHFAESKGHKMPRRLSEVPHPSW